MFKLRPDITLEKFENVSDTSLVVLLFHSEF